MISRPRTRARLLALRCRRRRRSALPRRLRLRANNFLLFVTFSIFPLSLSPFLPCILISRPWFSRPTPRRPAHLPSPERIWCLLTGSSSPSRAAVRQFWCHGRWHEPSDLWIQLAVHRRCHRLCRYDHSTPGLLTVSSLPRVESTPAGRQPGRTVSGTWYSM